MSEHLTICCENCGDPIEWTYVELSYALERIKRGDYAACACDDDCAAALELPWPQRYLEILLQEFNILADVEARMVRAREARKQLVRDFTTIPIRLDGQEYALRQVLESRSLAAWRAKEKEG